jgi:hypothetical protein
MTGMLLIARNPQPQSRAALDFLTAFARKDVSTLQGHPASSIAITVKSAAAGPPIGTHARQVGTLLSSALTQLLSAKLFAAHV